MKSLRFLDRRTGFSVAAVGMLLAMVVPAVFPTFTSADQVSDRSVSMSTSVYNQPSDYTITFTPATTTGPAYVDFIFCNGTSGSLEGNSCTGPTGYTDASATLDAAHMTDTGATIDQASPSNTMTVETTLSSGANTFILNGVQNPSTEDVPYYLRIETFTGGSAKANAEAAATTPTTVTGVTDYGGVAMMTTTGIAVNAEVEETMTFCVSGYNSATPPAAGCASGVTTPAINLGTEVGSTSNYILGTGAVSTATDYAQLSTNAANGAVVDLQTSTAGCGGLVLNGGATCGIHAQDTPTTGDVAAGSGLFGLEVGSSAGEAGGSTPVGTLSPATNYGASHYFLDYAGNDTTGVTSPYGSPLLTTSGPIANEYVPITFGASAAPTTPAGIYSATMGMTAVGTF